MLPVYWKRFPLYETDTHCICNRYKDRTAQAFYYSGATSAHITCSVAELTLKFCRSSSSEAVYRGPHSLQLYPDANISSLLRLVDELSFTHLRFLIIDCAPQVLYFLKSSEPFGGILSSTGNSLEELTFSGIESMQSSDLKRMLNKHAFSCRRFPRLRRLALQGHLGTEVPPEHLHGGQKMSCSLELRRERSTTFGATSVSVDVSYSYWDSPRVERPSQADGFAKFEISNWCCFSGLCSESKPSGTGSLADGMSLGSIVKWSLPTIESVLGALQTDTLGQFAQVIEMKVSAESAPNNVAGPKLLAYITQTFPRVSSLALCFSTVADIGQVIHLDDQEEKYPCSAILVEHLAALGKLRTLKFLLSHNAAATIASCLTYSQNTISTTADFESLIPQNQHRQVISELDKLFAELYFVGPKLPNLQGAILEVDITSTGMWTPQQRISTPPSSSASGSPLALSMQQELGMMFRRTRAASPDFLTIRIL
ncbi:hypothetical protein BT96DRAFT_216671 [Gymnopus androsaceus JB14]|uniref:Uncharacterized protein n=1 Tax=Gymnopus androsaceus JB14 TaxID=1447944 RepID=A0A6A4H8H5_9AGAR|nr:hypothetical protein BT96DRAFT_216671 [Gymnopus androsaceus JB14]